MISLRLGVHGGPDMELCSQVPNIKGVEQLSVSEIAGHLGRLQQLAEEGHLHQEDLEGAQQTLCTYFSAAAEGAILHQVKIPMSTQPDLG